MDNKKYKFFDYFDINEIQRIQDLFSDAMGVASIITAPDGKPITKPSGFCEFCKSIRNTESGLKNCMISDAVIGRPKSDGPRIQKCVSGGLYDGGASITVGSEHIANWLIGQVVNDDVSEDRLIKYAKNLGVDDIRIDDYVKDIPRMSYEQFKKISDYLYYNANMLSQLAHENMLIKQEVEKRKQVEKELDKDRTLFEMLITNISDVIAVLNIDGIIKYQSPNINKYFGWEVNDVLRRSVYDFVHPEDFAYAHGVLREITKEPETFRSVRLRLKCKDGSFKHIQVDAINLIHDITINGILLNYNDITQKVALEVEKENTEKLLRTQQRLEAIGTLASGVAHEINNPINGIMNYSQLIIDSEDENESKEYADEIINESKRIAEIVKGLLQFSRSDDQKHSIEKIEDILENSLTLVRTILKKYQIDIIVNIEENIPSIKCNSQQIQQVIINLITNARDAINSKYEKYNENKKIFITCKVVEVDNKKYLRTTVKDLGNGIPESIKEKIFTPFFTTKSRHHGTGLGLAISYKIVKGHNGELSFNSEIGQYTKVHLDLPII